jgi:hypothetical protein
MEKEFLTPGRLYAKMSEELRARQERRCDECHMPMVYLCENPGEASANWIVEPSPAACAACEELIGEIVRKHAARYDLWDPTMIYARPCAPLYIPNSGPRPH